MKRILKNMLLLLALFPVFQTASAQWCSGVQLLVYGANPQSGPVNIYGVRASIQAEYVEDITITGIIHGSSNEQPFSITIYKGTTEASTGLFYQTGPDEAADVTIHSITPCPEVTSYYAGVFLTYETANGLLRFNSANDLNTVIDALDAADETWNQNYENQYPNLTADQLDDMDETTGFDEFLEYRQFEGMFAGFYSKRQQIEEVEAAWLNSDFATTDPDVYDLTADDALNAICNSNNSFKIGNDWYELTVDGLYVNGTLQVASNGLRMKTREELAAAEAARQAFYASDQIGLAGPSLMANNDDDRMHPGCRTNRKRVAEQVINGEMYKLKVALTSVWVRSTVKTKVVHYKHKRGKFRRARAKLAVYCAGIINDNGCTFLFDMSKRHPSGGFKNRKQLKVTERAYGIIWRMQNNQVSGGFEQDNGNTGVLTLNW